MTTTDLPVHPTTGLRALGSTSRGPIWPQMGGDGTGDGSTGQDSGQQGTGGDGGQGTGQQGAGQDQQNSGGQGQQGGQEPPVGPDGQPWDADRASRLVANLRKEIADLKGKQNGGGQQQAGQQGQAPAPQQTIQQPQQGQQQAGQEPPADDGTADKLAAATVELAIFKAAGKHSADPAALTDSRSFMDQVSKLDASADDYDKKVADLIKATVDKHPHYRSGQAPGTAPRGGSDGTGRPGAPNRPRNIDDAVAARMTGGTGKAT